MGAPRQSEFVEGAETYTTSGEEKTADMTGTPIEVRIFDSGVSVPESPTICICSRQRHTFFIVLPGQNDRSEAESDNDVGPTCPEPVAEQGRIFLELEPGSRELLLSQQGRAFAFSTTACLANPLQQQGKANAGMAVTPTKQQHTIRAIERFKLDPDGNSPIP
jgi:hypothetical protein